MGHKDYNLNLAVILAKALRKANIRFVQVV